MQAETSPDMEKIREAAMLASRITVENDDVGVSIYVRAYGFLIECRREVGDDLVRKTAQVLFDHLSGDRNPLIEAIEVLMDTTKKK